MKQSFLLQRKLGHLLSQNMLRHANICHKSPLVGMFRRQEVIVEHFYGKHIIIA